MKYMENNAAHSALLEFAALGSTGRDYFIRRLNDFLLASPKRRKQLKEDWELALRDLQAKRCPQPDAKNTHR